MYGQNTPLDKKRRMGSVDLHVLSVTRVLQLEPPSFWAVCSRDQLIRTNFDSAEAVARFSGQSAGFICFPRKLIGVRQVLPFAVSRTQLQPAPVIGPVEFISDTIEKVPSHIASIFRYPPIWTIGTDPIAAQYSLTPSARAYPITGQSSTRPTSRAAGSFPARFTTTQSLPSFSFPSTSSSGASSRWSGGIMIATSS